MKRSNKKEKIDFIKIVKRLYFLMFKNCQTAFLHYSQKEDYTRKGFCVYYDSYADFKRQQKRTRAIGLSTFGIIISLVIVELFINLIFPVVFRSEASGGKIWSQKSQKDFLVEQATDDVYIGNSITLKAEKVAVSLKSKEDFAGGTTPVSDGLSASAVAGLSSARIGVNQGYFYNTKTKLVIPADQVMDVNIDKTSGFLFVSTLSGLVAIDTKKTISPDDDIIVKKFSSENGELSSNLVYQVFYKNYNLYVANGSGLDVFSFIDGKNIEKLASYGIKSQPALTYNKVKGVFVDKGIIYISTDGGGLNVIDTKNTTQQNDDVLVGVYDKKSFSMLGTDRISGAFLKNNILYIDTVGFGLAQIDTKGTLGLSDDEFLESPVSNGKVNTSLSVDDYLLVGISQGGLVVIDSEKKLNKYLARQDVSSLFYDSLDNMVYVGVSGKGLFVFSWDNGKLEQMFFYNNNSFPSIVSNNIKAITIGLNKEIYVATEDAGLSVITPGSYNKEGVFVSRPESIDNVNPIGVAWSVVGDTNNVELQIRTGTEKSVWEWKGENSLAMINDLWGGKFDNDQKTPEGVVFSGRENEKQSASFQITANKTERSFSAGSIIRAKIKTNSLASNLSGVMFVDDWNSTGCYFTPANDWQIVTCVTDSDFSRIGFNLRWSDGWQNSDNFVIFSLTIENPKEGWGEWKPLALNKGYSDIDLLSDSKWWQYRINLKTDETKSPYIDKITFFNEYKSAGEYISPIIDAGSLAEWGIFKADQEKPDNTNLIFYVRGRNNDEAEWSSWQIINNGEKIDLSHLRYIQYRAQLFSFDNNYSPSFSNVEIRYFNIFE